MLCSQTPDLNLQFLHGHGIHTAERLNLHRNTVKYRVGKALAEVPADRDRLDLALALTVCEFLGPVIFAH